MSVGTTRMKTLTLGAKGSYLQDKFKADVANYLEVEQTIRIPILNEQGVGRPQIMIDHDEEFTTSLQNKEWVVTREITSSIFEVVYLHDDVYFLYILRQINPDEEAS